VIGIKKFMVVSVNVIGIVVGVAENVHSVVGVAEKKKKNQCNMTEWYITRIYRKEEGWCNNIICMGNRPLCVQWRTV
jgi:hypothetical protein